MQENNTEASIEKTTSNYDSTNAEDEANDADNSNNSNNDGDDDDDNDEEEYDNRRPSVTRASYVIEPKHSKNFKIYIACHMCDGFFNKKD